MQSGNQTFTKAEDIYNAPWVQRDGGSRHASFDISKLKVIPFAELANRLFLAEDFMVIKKREGLEPLIGIKLGFVYYEYIQGGSSLQVLVLNPSRKQSQELFNFNSKYTDFDFSKLIPFDLTCNGKWGKGIHKPTQENKKNISVSLKIRYFLQLLSLGKKIDSDIYPQIRVELNQLFLPKKIIKPTSSEIETRIAQEIFRCWPINLGFSLTSLKSILALIITTDDLQVADFNAERIDGILNALVRVGNNYYPLEMVMQDDGIPIKELFQQAIQQIGVNTIPREPHGLTFISTNFGYKQDEEEKEEKEVKKNLVDALKQTIRSIKSTPENIINRRVLRNLLNEITNYPFYRNVADIVNEWKNCHVFDAELPAYLTNFDFLTPLQKVDIIIRSAKKGFKKYFHELAFDYYEKACEYEKTDNSLAYRYYFLSAEVNYAPAKARLVDCYMADSKRISTRVSYDEIAFTLYQSERDDSTYAYDQLLLGRMYLSLKKVVEAWLIFQEAIEVGEFKAIDYMRTCFTSEYIESFATYFASLEEQFFSKANALYKSGNRPEAKKYYAAINELPVHKNIELQNEAKKQLQLIRDDEIKAARYYINGQKNFNQREYLFALANLQEASRLGSGKAKKYLATLYGFPLPEFGIKKDLDKVKTLLLEAGALGIGEAYCDLATTCCLNSKEEENVYYFKALKMGVDSAAEYLAKNDLHSLRAKESAEFCLEQARVAIMEQDFNKANKWYQAAEHFRHPGSMHVAALLKSAKTKSNNNLISNNNNTTQISEEKLIENDTKQIMRTFRSLDSDNSNLDEPIVNNNNTAIYSFEFKKVSTSIRNVESSTIASVTPPMEFKSTGPAI